MTDVALTSDIATAVTGLDSAISSAQTAIIAAMPSTTGLATEAAVEAAIAASQAAVIAAIPSGGTGGGTVPTGVALTTDVTTAETAINSYASTLQTGTISYVGGIFTTLRGSNTAATLTAILSAIPSVAALATSTAVAAVQTTVNAIQTTVGAITSTIQGYITSAVSTLQGSGSGNTLTSLASAIAALPTATGIFLSGEVKQFVSGSVPSGWTQLSPGGYLSKGYGPSQRQSIYNGTSYNSGVGLCAASNGSTTLLYSASWSASASGQVIYSYNPVTDTWATAATRPGQMPVTGYCQLLTLPSNAVFSVGSGIGTYVAYSWNPVTGGWTTLAAPTKCGPLLILDSTGAYVYCFGGRAASAAACAAISIYSISGNSWTAKTSTQSFGTASASPYANVAGCLLPSGKMLLVDVGVLTVPNYAVYDPTTDTFTVAATSAGIPAGTMTNFPCFIPTSTGAIFYAGGAVGNGVYIYNESANTWTNTGTWGPPVDGQNATFISGYGTYIAFGSLMSLIPATTNITALVNASKN